MTKWFGAFLLVMCSAAFAVDIEVSKITLGKSDAKAAEKAMRAEIPEYRNGANSRLSLQNYEFYVDAQKRTRGISAHSLGQPKAGAKTKDSIHVVLAGSGVVSGVRRTVDYEVVKTGGRDVAEVAAGALSLEQVQAAIKSKYGEPHYQGEAIPGVGRLVWIYEPDGRKSSVDTDEYLLTCRVIVFAGKGFPVSDACDKTVLQIDIEAVRVKVGANKILSQPYVRMLETAAVAGHLFIADAEAAYQADQAKAKAAAKPGQKVDL